MLEIDATAASISVTKKQKVLINRNYGWLDKKQTKPFPYNGVIGIASCEKPITNAAIKVLFKKKRLKLNTKLTKILKITPEKTKYDKRIHKITIQHILDHTSGWGPTPLLGIDQSFRSKSRKEQVKAILENDLIHKPGEVAEYCNFGYDLLRYILRAGSKKTPTQFFIEDLPDVANTFYDTVKESPKQTPAVWNVKDGGPIAASSLTLCSFMEAFWLNGEERRSSGQNWAMYGSLPTSTAIMFWHPNGHNIAIIFNSRGSVNHDQIRARIEPILAKTLKVVKS